MQVFEQDDVKRHEGKEEKSLTTDRIRFKVSDTCYYSVSVDKEFGSLRIYKSGFPDDRIVITCQGANVILVK